MQVEKLVCKAANRYRLSHPSDPPSSRTHRSRKDRMVSPSSSPATSPALPHSSSPTPPPPPSQGPGLYNPTAPQHKMAGIPSVAAASKYTAPVHIDVGGAIYTSSLETLTRFPESRLARLFNGTIPIVLDSLKQHYFIDRDGKMFRHVLNYMRHGRLILPDDFTDFELLLEEARFFEITGLVGQLEEHRRNKQQQLTNNNNDSLDGHSSSDLRQYNSNNNNDPDALFLSRCKNTLLNGIKREEEQLGYHVVAVHISPDLGERVMVSGERSVVEDLFPEVAQAIMEARSAMVWNHDPKFIIKFPLNGYCKLNSMQAVQRLLNSSFRVLASNGGGVEGQQFSEYIFYRKQAHL
uniref:BTB/POZ domain-containing protein kctd15-like n=2 Tax=Hirondellea gigas TaxID=1518452 RepID=A0A6A7GB03_9CRUS